MQEKYKALTGILAEASDLYHAGALLEWDQQVNMPHGGSESRSYQMGTLSKLVHERLTSDEVGKLLQELKGWVAEKPADSDEARLIAVTERNYNKQTRVPTEKVAEFVKLTSQAHGVWAEARQKNDFEHFRPTLERIVEMRREYAGYFAPFDHVYDPLLDDYEPGMKTADVKAIFNAVRPVQVELIHAISQRPQVDDSFLHQAFDETLQWQLSKDILTRIGYDWDHGRLDAAAHPFSINFGRDDVRVTSRVNPEFFNPCFFASLHECGHAFYEAGSDPRFERSPLAGGASMALHESQSRTWENLVGRSLAFWKYYYPTVQATFPSQLGNVDMMSFYKAVNRVQPSLIRVEADEASYNLHIMLRLEIEIALMEGSIAVKDLPEYWNTRMQEYLGLTPPNNAQGVLQDVHWSAGYFGYFPTYALGNIISAQLWEAMQRDLPDIDERIERGDFAALLGWQRQKLHQYSAKFEPQDMVMRITGSKIDPAPYLKYLQTKYSQIYGL